MSARAARLQLVIKPADTEGPDVENFITGSLGYAFWVDRLMIAPELIMIQPLGEVSTENDREPQSTITPMLNFAGQF